MRPGSGPEGIVEGRTSQARRSGRRIVISALAGLIVFALIFFWGGGRGPEPGTCFGLFGWYTVPCDGWVSWTAGGATAVVVFLVLWVSDRRRRT
jgi:hypothetical protein